MVSDSEAPLALMCQNRSLTVSAGVDPWPTGVLPTLPTCSPSFHTYIE